VESTLSAAESVSSLELVSAGDARLPALQGVDYGSLGPHHFLYTEARAFARYAELGTDKATAHQYHLLYARVLWPYRQALYAELKERGFTAPDAGMLDPAADDKRFKMLEVGLGCTMPVPFGGFHLFRRYLPNTKYFSFEFRPKECFPQTMGGTRRSHVDPAVLRNLRRRSGVLPDDLVRPKPAHLRYLHEHMYEGDQGNDTDLQGAVDRFGPMDIIIDDGSHCMTHMRSTFRFLFLHMLRPGGTYIVEDLQTNLEAQAYYCYEPDSHPARKTFIQYVHDVVTSLSLRRDIDPQLHFNASYTADDDITDWIQDVTCDREICAFTKKLQRFNLQKRPLQI